MNIYSMELDRELPSQVMVSNPEAAAEATIQRVMKKKKNLRKVEPSRDKETDIEDQRCIKKETTFQLTEDFPNPRFNSCQAYFLSEGAPEPGNKMPSFFI